MQRNQKEISAKGIVLLFLGVITALAMQEGLVSNPIWYNVAFVTLPAMFLMLLIPNKEKS